MKILLSMVLYLACVHYGPHKGDVAFTDIGKTVAVTR